MLSQLFHISDYISEGLKAWLKCVGIGTGIGATIGAGIALIGLIFVVWGIGSLILNSLGIPAPVLIRIGLLIGLIICSIPDGKNFCYAILVCPLVYCLLLGGLAGGLVGGAGTAVALILFAEKWKKRYCDLICNWIHNNFEDSSSTKEFLIEKVFLASEALAFVLRRRKPGLIEANIIAKKDNGSTIDVSIVEIPLEEVQVSGLSHQQVLLGSKEEFLEMESGI